MISRPISTEKCLRRRCNVSARRDATASASFFLSRRFLTPRRRMLARSRIEVLSFLPACTICDLLRYDLSFPRLLEPRLPAKGEASPRLQADRATYKRREGESWCNTYILTYFGRLTIAMVSLSLCLLSAFLAFFINRFSSGIDVFPVSGSGLKQSDLRTMGQANVRYRNEVGIIYLTRLMGRSRVQAHRSMRALPGGDAHSPSSFLAG